jgi:hypothetical protein
MAALEDTTNFGLCGLFLIMLVAMCVVAFSAVTVKYFHTYIYIHFETTYLEFFNEYLWFEKNTNINECD